MLPNCDSASADTQDMRPFWTCWLAPGDSDPSEPALAYPRSLAVRQTRIFWLLTAAWVVNVFDLGFTVLAEQQRVLVELNPIAATVMDWGGAGLFLYKASLLLAGSIILWRCRRLELAEATAWAYAFVCLVLAIHWRQVYIETEPLLVLSNTAARLVPGGE